LSYKEKINALELFNEPVNFFSWPELKWNINGDIDENKLDNLIEIFKEIIELVEQEVIEKPST